MAEPRITIIGGGAIGGISAAWLVRRGFNPTVLETWPEHRQMMIAGLEVSGCRGSFNVPLNVIEPRALKGPLELVFLAVKSMHTESVLRHILPLMTKASTVVSLQNSINEDLIADLVGQERTVGCIVGWGAITEGPGQLSQASPGEFVIGRLNGQRDEKLEQIGKIMGNVAETFVTDNIYGFLWAKLLANCAISVGALQGKTVAEMVASPEACRAVGGVVGEVLAVAAETGITLETVKMQFKPEFYREQKDFIAESLLNILRETHGAILPTAYQDYLQNRPLETDFINGYVVKKGYEVGIKTPLNTLLVAMMREIEVGQRSFGFENIIELNKKQGT
ncbi:MAG: 2-dehydropantoate 2-reductase [Firmicutes bacterium]|nr:2-dehydropantoate 2-reductase [Bacillota bacterium]